MLAVLVHQLLRFAESLELVLRRGDVLCIFVEMLEPAVEEHDTLLDLLRERVAGVRRWDRVAVLGDQSDWQAATFKQT